MADSTAEAARGAVRQNYMGFAAVARAKGNRSFTIDLERVTDNEYRYEATYRVDDHTEDTLTGTVHRHGDGWTIEPDHEPVE